MRLPPEPPRTEAAWTVSSSCPLSAALSGLDRASRDRWRLPPLWPRDSLRCSGASSGDDREPSVAGWGDATSGPGERIGNSSSAARDALADPGFRTVNPSSMGAAGIGMGAEMVPRMDLCPDLERPTVEPDFPKMAGMTLGENRSQVRRI